MTDNPPHAHALLRFGLNTPNARRLMQFYEQAFGARTSTRGKAKYALLRLGDATIELMQHAELGRPYPPQLSPYDTRFQHLCIVVTDMHSAMQRLMQTDGWSAISANGPQKLPDSAGGVTAFKFRDPDGHPLEFLQFGVGKVPPHWRTATSGDNHQGIDHSALSVADAQRSVRFYESLGLRQSSETLNQGAAQERLDGVLAPKVDVIGLAPHQSTPHVELLHYHTAARPIHDALAANDIAATQLVFAIDSASQDKTSRFIQDPDGHFLRFE